MKQQCRTSKLPSRSVSQRSTENKVVFKCRKQRSGFIKREVNAIIRKQLNYLFVAKKLEKQLQQHQKDVVFMPTENHNDRVHHFRRIQKQKQWEKLKEFQMKNTERFEKVAIRLKQKQTCHQTKLLQNFSKLVNVQKRFQQSQEKQENQFQKVKEKLSHSTSRHNYRLSTGVTCNQKILNRVNTAKLLHESKDKMTVNNFLHKMKDLEEKRVKKQVQAQKKRMESAKNFSKCTIGLRSKKQQDFMTHWSNDYQKRFQKFEQNRTTLGQRRQRMIQERLIQRSLNQEQVIQRKMAKQEELADMRFTKVEKKIKKINKIRREGQKDRSKQNFHHNVKKLGQDSQKQQHSSVVRKIYQIIQKLKGLKENQVLKKSEVDFLIQNLDPSENTLEYKEICRYLNSTKEKFFQNRKKD